MGQLGNDFRKRAAEQRTAADVLMDSDEIKADRFASKFVPAIVGYVTANMLAALGELIDCLQGLRQVDSSSDRRRTILEKNDAIRRAAAKGDWGEFDRIVGSFADHGEGGDPGATGS